MLVTCNRVETAPRAACGAVSVVARDPRIRATRCRKSRGPMASPQTVPLTPPAAKGPACPSASRAPRQAPPAAAEGPPQRPPSAPAPPGLAPRPRQTGTGDVWGAWRGGTAACRRQRRAGAARAQCWAAPPPGLAWWAGAAGAPRLRGAGGACGALPPAGGLPGPSASKARGPCVSTARPRQPQNP